MGLMQQGQPRGLWRPTRERRLTATFKGMVEEELRKLGPAKFHQWAEANPTEFYRIAARLLPKTIEGEVRVTAMGELSDGELKAMLVDAESRLRVLERLEEAKEVPYLVEGENLTTVEVEDAENCG